MRSSDATSPDATSPTRSSSWASLLCVTIGVVIGSSGTFLIQRQGGAQEGGIAEVTRPSGLHHRRLESVTLGEERKGKGKGERLKPLNTFDGVYPVLREWGCGHGNMDTPKTLLAGGFGEAVVVDVGLGTDAGETIAAVKNGFIVFAFEPMPENYAAVKNRVYTSLGKAHYEFVTLTQAADGSWSLPATILRGPPELARRNRQGYAYIINAAVGAEGATLYLGSSRGGDNQASVTARASRAQGAGVARVPQVALDSFLPPWAESIHLLKIDTQGFELRVLTGAIKSLRARRFRYVLYEFSPWLMKQGELGDPAELLRLMPEMRAICFDMMGLHNMFPRTSRPLESYYDDLIRGNNSYMYGNQLPVSGVVPKDGIGPWDDIMCFFPEAQPRRVPLEQGIFGHKKYWEPNSFGKKHKMG